MTVYPCCKINIALNITGKRPDGYHDLETIFYPVPLCDELSVSEMNTESSCGKGVAVKVTGDFVDCSPNDNLVVKAYNLISKDYSLPPVDIHLHKVIPSQAGLGGGSSNAAYMIKVLNAMFNLGMTDAVMERYALQLGADCPFFIKAEPVYASGVGEIFSPVDNGNFLQDKWIALVKPDVSVSTREAFAGIKPHIPAINCRETISRPYSDWKRLLVNDFEESIFPQHNELARIKQRLYENGAFYAQMSGSGSTVYGLFESKPEGIEMLFPDEKVFVVKL